MNRAQSKDAGLLLLALIVTLDRRKESDDKHSLGGTGCRINESRSSAARLSPPVRGSSARRTHGPATGERGEALRAARSLPGLPRDDRHSVVVLVRGAFARRC